MTHESHTPPIMLAILALNLVNSYNLFRSWFDSPLEKISWLVFLIWLLPVAYHLIKNRQRQPKFSAFNVFIAGLSLLAVLLSFITTLNVLAYCGLALAFAANLPWSWGNFIWMASAVVWMPAFGWLLAHQLPRTMPLAFGYLLRVVLIFVGVICAMISTKNRFTHE